MGVIKSGHNSSGFPNNFGASDAVTAAGLNNHVNDSTFNTTAVDDSTIEVYDSGAKIRVKDGGITTVKINDEAVTTGKLGPDCVTSAKIANDVFIGGAPTTNTQAKNNNSTRLATTEYVDRVTLDPVRSYNSLSHNTDTDTIILNDTGFPLLVNMGIASTDDIANLQLLISENSDMSSESTLSRFKIRGDGTHDNKATVSGIVPAGLYWQIKYEASNPYDKFHISFKI